METKFKEIKNKDEEYNAKKIISSIDRGEKEIFEDNEIENRKRLYYSENHTIGVYCEYIIKDEIHIQIGFNEDMPEEVNDEVLNFIKGDSHDNYEVLNLIKGDSHDNYNIRIWYSPRNKKLEEFLLKKLIYKEKGEEIYEFTLQKKMLKNEECTYIINNLEIVPFKEKYINDVCNMFDKSLAHTFDNPNEKVFLNSKNTFLHEWIYKSNRSEFYVVIEKNNIIGAYILDGLEIDILTVAINKQGKGIGKYILNHAMKHILELNRGNPYLYCMKSNLNAVEFYKHEGFEMTGYSSYIALK